MLREEYKGTINVGFNGMPAIELETFIAPDNASDLERISIATKRRRFILKDDWEIDLSEIEYVKELNGTVVLPMNDSESNPNVFDGASVPVPWLVSLLTIGVLRPLGVMLIGSILHDYAYTHGNLIVKNNGVLREVKLKRHHADKLFRDIIGTVNNLRFIGYIAWLAVRIGWLWVPYNRTYHSGRTPYSEYIFVILMVVLVFYAESVIGARFLFSLFFGIYLVLYICTLLLHKRYR